MLGEVSGKLFDIYNHLCVLVSQVPMAIFFVPEAQFFSELGKLLIPVVT